MCLMGFNGLTLGHLCSILWPNKNKHRTTMFHLFCSADCKNNHKTQIKGQIPLTFIATVWDDVNIDDHDGYFCYLLHRVSVSRAVRPFGVPNRPSDWFSQKVGCLDLISSNIIGLFLLNSSGRCWQSYNFQLHFQFSCTTDFG